MLALSATGQDSARRSWAYAVPAGGGTPRRLDFGPVSDVAFAADGPTVVVTSTMTRDMAWWKRYRGGTAGQLWWDRDGTGEFERIAAELDGQLGSPMIVGSGAERRIAFLSDHEGWGNVYSLGADGHRAAPAHRPRRARARRPSTPGTPAPTAAGWSTSRPASCGCSTRWTPAAGRAGWTSGSAARAPPASRTACTPRPSWSSVAPDRTGRTSIALVRGTVHRLTHRDGPARTLLAAPGARARLAHPLDADRAVWVDDVEGEDAVCVAPLDARRPTGRRRRAGTGPVSWAGCSSSAPAPDGSAVALASHDGRLLVLDPAAGALRELARGAAGEISDLCWSPDSAWLAYCDPVEPGLRRIMMARLADDTLVAVTPPRFVDSDPVFTSDGRYLAFLSRRSFDPIYDEHAFDLTFPRRRGRSWCRWPRAPRRRSGPARTAARCRPPRRARRTRRPRSRPTAPRTGAGRRAGGAGGHGRRRRRTTPPTVTVDVDGLADRVVPIPVVAARYCGMRAGKDCLLWYRLPVAGVLGDGRAGTEDKPQRPVLERYDLTRRKLDVIADPVSAFAVSGDGTRLVVRDRQHAAGAAHRPVRLRRPGRRGTDGGADEFEVDTRRIVVTVDPAAEWRQMFDEAGRLMRDHFWTADMGGVDWAAELARYRPLVDAVGSHDDLVDLLWELQGELGTSHAYVSRRGGRGLVRAGPACSAPTWRRTSGRRLAGAADAAAGDLGPGRAQPAVRPGRRRAGRRRDPGGRRGRRSTRRTARRRCWWRGRRAGRADRALRAGPGRRGRAAPGRGAAAALRGGAALPGLGGRPARVRRRALRRPARLPARPGHDGARAGRSSTATCAWRWPATGLIVDVRGNGGGHTSQLVVEKLARRIIGWDAAAAPPARHLPAGRAARAGRGGRRRVLRLRRRHRHRGDQAAGHRAGGRHAHLGRGDRHRRPLRPGRRHLVTQPRYAFWFDGSGWGVENHGVDPDVEVVIRPQDWVAGRDPQLERAVDLAMAGAGGAARGAPAGPGDPPLPGPARSPAPPVTRWAIR